MKRLISIVLAACLSLLSVFTVFACGSIDMPNGGNDAKRYYLYNAEQDVFDKSEYMEIVGNDCSLVKNNDGITVTSTGVIVFTDSGFTVTCTSELLGVTITKIMSGEKESNGVLRVDSQTVIGMTSTPATEYEVMYYCLENTKPASPIVQYTITFDANGGAFGGETQKAVKTNVSGTVSLPDAPTRGGYDFNGFYKEKTGGNDVITNTTVFDRSTTVYARWTERNSNAQRYYYYNDRTDTLDKTDYMDIDDGDVMLVKINGGTTVRQSGIIVYDGDNFTITVQEVLILRGEREDSGILHFTSVTIVDNGTEIEDTTESYYCLDGVKPTIPNPPIIDDGTFKVVFNAAPGKFADGTQTKTVKTDADGKIVLPDAPTRNGYKFKGFKSLYFNGYITADTVFTRDTTLTAEFVEVHTVEFTVEGEIVETRKIEDGEPLGDYDCPDIPENMYYKYHMFKGWYEKYTSNNYRSTTRITKSVTLTAEFYTHSEVETYQSNVSKWSEPGHLYIHYLRKDAEVYTADTKISSDMSNTAYEDWLLWAWPSGGEGRAYAPIRKGMYGIVYDIDMKKTYNDGGWNGQTLTHENKPVNYFGKDIGIMFFNDKSRQQGAGIWQNDGGNLLLRKSFVFAYWDSGVDPEANPEKIKYLFDENYSVHLIFMRDYISQSVIDDGGVMMFVHYHNKY